MSGKIHDYLAGDHERLDALLAGAVSDPENIDAAAYAQFRAGLLKHIGIEEKVLFTEARKRRGGEALALAAKLRLDHGALTALLVPSPTARIVAAIGVILSAHNPVEEKPGGVYEECEQLAGSQADRILHEMRNFPDVKVLPHVDSQMVMEATRRALARAGYDLEV